MTMLQRRAACSQRSASHDLPDDFHVIASRRVGAKAPPDDRLCEAIHLSPGKKGVDCFVALLLAMTMWRDRALPDRNVTAQRANQSSHAKTCPVLAAKIFRFANTPNQIWDSRHPAPPEGRFAIVTDVERDAVDD
jgi:hypothetical protein